MLHLISANFNAMHPARFVLLLAVAPGLVAARSLGAYPPAVGGVAVVYLLVLAALAFRVR